MSTTASDLTRESGPSISSNQPNTIVSTKSPSKKQKSSSIHNGLSSAAVSAQSPDIPSLRVASGDRPFRRYSRRTLVALSKSPLVVIPAGMPALKDWFGDYEPHLSPRKDNDHHATNSTSSARNRTGRRDGGEDDSRSSYKSQFAQNSQMGNFRHHSSRLDERADRDSHERLRNLSETYDRNKLLASSAAAKRDPLPKNGTSLTSRRDERDKDVKDKDRTDLSPWDRKDNLKSERSGDWRRPNATTQDNEDASERRGLGSKDRPLDDDSRKERSLRMRGRSPSPDQASERTRGWERRRSQSRPRVDKDESADRDRRGLGRRAKDVDPADDRDRRAVNGNSRRIGRDGERDRDRDGHGRLDGRSQRDSTAREKEPAWMGDYVPESDKVFGARASEADLDDLQSWKRQLKDKELASSGETSKPSNGSSSETNGEVLDDIQRFKLKIKEEQEKRDMGVENLPQTINASLNAPPGLSPTNDTPRPLLPPFDITNQSELPTSSIPQPSTQQSTTSDRVMSAPEPLFGGAGEIRLFSETQSALSVAGIDSDYSYSRLTSTSHVNPMQMNRDNMNPSTKPPSNGRLTPTPSAPFTSYTSGTSPSQYGAERTDSPGSSTSPAPQSGGKGSRFAKFWDNKPKETASSTSSPVASSAGFGGFSNSPWTSNAAPQDLRTSRPQSQSGGSVKGIDSLLQHLSVNESPMPRTHSTSNNPEADRMQNLLSMLNPSQAPSSRVPDLYNSRPPYMAHDMSHPPLPSGAPRMQQYPSYSNQSNALPPMSSPDLDRNFVPDGMVPGLRPPMRSREQSLGQLPPLNLATTPGAGAPFGDDGRDIFAQRLQHQGSWEQLQNRQVLSNNYNGNGQGQHHGPPRMSTLPPSSQQLNALRQSPNHLLQQQQLLRNPRNNLDLSAFAGAQFAAQSGGMNVGGNMSAQQYGGAMSGNSGMGSSNRLQDTMQGQNYNGNGVGGFDFPPPRETQNRMLMGGLSMNGPSMRDLDVGRSNGPGMPMYQSQSLQQQQHLLQQLQPLQPPPNNQGMPYGMQLPPIQQLNQPNAPQMHGSIRPLNPPGVPNDYQSYGGRQFGGPGSGIGHSQQGQPDLMALLMGRPPSYRGE